MKKTLSLILAVCMILTVAMTVVSAEDLEPIMIEPAPEDGSFTYMGLGDDLQSATGTWYYGIKIPANSRIGLLNGVVIRYIDNGTYPVYIYEGSISEDTLVYEGTVSPFFTLGIVDLSEYDITNEDTDLYIITAAAGATGRASYVVNDELPEADLANNIVATGNDPDTATFVASSNVVEGARWAITAAFDASPEIVFESEDATFAPNEFNKTIGIFAESTTTLETEVEYQWYVTGINGVYEIPGATHNTFNAVNLYGASATYFCEAYYVINGYKYSSYSNNITVTVPFLRGDVNGDRFVDHNDAIYVLLNHFFPENYPMTQDADFDGNGKTGVSDAIYLLLHTFFPTEFVLAD